MSDKYYRLLTFVVDVCPRTLREFFLVKAASDPKPGVTFTTLDAYLYARKLDVDALHRRSTIRKDQYALIYPAIGTVNLVEWDVTLLATLILHLFKGKLQNVETCSINGIRDVRNKLQHLSSTGTISDKDFNTFWTGLEHASLLLANNSSGSKFQQQISMEINQVMTENMPGLCNVLKKWYSEINMQLQHHIKTLEEKVDQLQETLEKQSVEMKLLKDDTKTSKTILSKATTKRKGRSGVPEKRIKIVDNKVEKMKENFMRTMSREIQGGFSGTDEAEVSLITQQLQDNNRVVVSGHDNSLAYKSALAAVFKMNYQSGRCVEISNPVDWKRICPEDADIVLFREPFGRSVYDSHKVEIMLEEFDNMLVATDDDNDFLMRIIIVANQHLLEQVTKHSEHEMLELASIVYIESGNARQGHTCLDEKVDHLQETLEKQSSEIAQLKENTRVSLAVLTSVCSTRRGRLGTYDLDMQIEHKDSSSDTDTENTLRGIINPLEDTLALNELLDIDEGATEHNTRHAPKNDQDGDPVADPNHILEISRQDLEKTTVEKIKLKMQQLRRFEQPVYSVSTEITVLEANHIITTLGNALEKKKIDAEEIANRHADFLERHHLRKQMFGDMQLISDTEYLDFYNRTGIDIDGRKHFIQELFDYIEVSVEKMVRFAKIVPGFTDLEIDDQVVLLRESRFEYEVTEPGMFVKLLASVWTSAYHVDDKSVNLLTNEYVEFKMKCLKKFEELALCHEELALVKAIIITFPDMCQLRGAADVEHIHNTLVACLLYQLAKRPPEKCLQVEKILEAIFCMRELKSWDNQIMQRNFDMCPEVKKHSLVRELCLPPAKK